MRHRSDPVADSDSDLSISEDEGFDDCVSLGVGNAQSHQEGIQVWFQLEKLRDTPKSVDGSVTTSVSKSNIQSKSKAGQMEDNADTLRFGNNFQFNPSAKNIFPCGIGDEEIVSDDKRRMPPLLDVRRMNRRNWLLGSSKNPLSSEGMEARSPTTRERTIVSSPSVCSCVNLEIGNLIRIYPPWLEVRVRGNNQNTILCTYYSQVSA